MVNDDTEGRMQYAPTNPQLNDRRGVLHTPIDFDNTITVDRLAELVSASPLIARDPETSSGRP